MLLLTLEMCGLTQNWLSKNKITIEKTWRKFLSFDFRFEIGTKNSFRKKLHPDALFSKKTPYGFAALW